MRYLGLKKSDVHKAFVVLDIPEKHRKQTYLAAFLSCWLYAFVLPVKNLGCIRPCILQTSSVSLAIPVLASNYKGLNDLSNSLTLSQQREHFPAHCVYAWIAQYFRSHRMTIHNFAGAAMELNWVANSMNGTTDMKAWKSIYALITKSPSPPASLGTGPSCKANFDIAAELKAYNNSFGTIDEDLLPAASDPVALYAASTIIARNFEAVHDAPPIPTVASSFKAQDMISEADRYAVGFLVKQMKTKLLHTPLSNIPALDPELKELFGYITSKNIDVASLREHVEAYVSRARSFHALESSENVQPSLSSLEERLTGVESRLSDVVNLKRNEEEQIKLQQAEILKIQQRSNELKKELNLLEQK
ncbi:Sphingosine 1-phosphate receptor 3 [Bienertia sinuspersici]